MLTAIAPASVTLPLDPVEASLLASVCSLVLELLAAGRGTTRRRIRRRGQGAAGRRRHADRTAADRCTGNRRGRITGNHRHRDRRAGGVRDMRVRHRRAVQRGYFADNVSLVCALMLAPPSTVIVAPSAYVVLSTAASTLALLALASGVAVAEIVTLVLAAAFTAPVVEVSVELPPIVTSGAAEPAITISLTLAPVAVAVRLPLTLAVMSRSPPAACSAELPPISMSADEKLVITAPLTADMPVPSVLTDKVEVAFSVSAPAVVVKLRAGPGRCAVSALANSPVLSRSDAVCCRGQRQTCSPSTLALLLMFDVLWIVSP